ncbi:unnamed protein product [Peniophora sp. CBMAI 1063]|nr:unnamed protein product [Peniophora sp. CBMAI 1063]
MPPIDWRLEYAKQELELEKRFPIDGIDDGYSMAQVFERAEQREYALELLEVLQQIEHHFLEIRARREVRRAVRKAAALEGESGWLARLVHALQLRLRDLLHRDALSSRSEVNSRTQLMSENDIALQEMPDQRSDAGSEDTVMPG